jgi:hypothetical protein
MMAQAAPKAKLKKGAYREFSSSSNSAMRFIAVKCSRFTVVRCCVFIVGALFYLLSPSIEPSKSRVDTGGPRTACSPSVPGATDELSAAC